MRVSLEAMTAPWPRAGRSMIGGASAGSCNAVATPGDV